MKGSLDQAHFIEVFVDQSGIREATGEIGLDGRRSPCWVVGDVGGASARSRTNVSSRSLWPLSFGAHHAGDGDPYLPIGRLGLFGKTPQQAMYPAAC